MLSNDPKSLISENKYIKPRQKLLPKWPIPEDINENALSNSEYEDIRDKYEDKEGDIRIHNKIFKLSLIIN